jgi:hypothetical protein
VKRFGRPRYRHAVAEYVLEPDEDEVGHAFDLACEASGWHVTRTSQKRRSRVTPGMPDRFVAHPVHRLYAWVELKAPGGRLSAAQTEWIAAVRSAGCPVLVVDDVQSGMDALWALRKDGP